MVCPPLLYSGFEMGWVSIDKIYHFLRKMSKAFVVKIQKNSAARPDSAV
jgi:hypothetical protein